MQPATIIRSLASQWRRDFGLTPQQINEGNCVSFAWQVTNNIPGSRVIWSEDDDHAYVRYRGRLYDAEAPQGVRRYTQLPAIRRQRC